MRQIAKRVCDFGSSSFQIYKIVLNKSSLFIYVSRIYVSSMFIRLYTFLLLTDSYLETSQVDNNRITLQAVDHLNKHLKSHYAFNGFTANAFSIMISYQNAD